MTRTGFPERLRVSHQSRRPTDVRRRNGKLQSCEPCRKAKLRCDHMMPACGRCTRRNKTEQCTYHPAPLTKALPTPPTSQVAEAETASSSPRALSAPDTRPTFGRFAFAPPDEAAILRTAPQPEGLSAQSLANADGPGAEEFRHQPLPNKLLSGDTFYSSNSDNFVSHYALLHENEASLGIIPPNMEPPSAANIPKSHIDKGALVLSLLKDLPQFETYIDKWFSFTRGIIIIEPMMKLWSTGVWNTWQRVLKSQNGLQEMSERLWHNSLQPLSHILSQTTTPREFSANTTGEDLRWEIVGIILTMVGLLAQSLQDGDPIFCSHEDAPIDRAALALRMYNASELCLKFCMDFDIMNDLVLWFMYENTILSGSMHVKGSFYNFQKRGQLCSALLASGLHQEIKVDKDTPFFIAEFRKRMFISAYENDKYNAAFIGRPPHLTRNYCRIQLPLDLSDAQTMSDGLDLENSLNSLDEEGWNQQGTVQRCTFSRIFAHNALITEEILEISLGFLSNDEISRRAADIESRANELWSELPSFLKIDEEHYWDLKRAPIELIFLAYIRLAHLGHHFLLQRTLIKKVGADSTKLLAVARETFDFVLLLVNYRDMLRDFQIDFFQFLCMYGIPSAAVVAVELLRQEQSSSSMSAPTNRLPRSDTIQSLSVLVACLSTTRQENQGHLICERGRRFLKKIIDTILEPAPTAAVENNPATGLGELGDPSFTTPLFQTGTDGDFVRWLESMEWEQESWVNFN